MVEQNTLNEGSSGSPYLYAGRSQSSRSQAAEEFSTSVPFASKGPVSIAHEINNPLEAITNLLFLMHGELTPEQMKAFLADAEHELARVTEITKQTLRFYREPSQPVATEVHAVLDSVLKFFGTRIVAAGIVVQRDEVPSENAKVLSTPGELRQVLANLIGNAIDAMRRGGRLRVRISEHGQSSRSSCNIRITIADTGIGIPREVLPTIFEPFVTTKGETGTGLGLWVTAEIMKMNGWRIRVRTCRDPRRSGTIFSIVIPKLSSVLEGAA